MIDDIEILSARDAYSALMAVNDSLQIIAVMPDSAMKREEACIGLAMVVQKVLLYMESECHTIH